MPRLCRRHPPARAGRGRRHRDWSPSPRLSKAARAKCREDRAIERPTSHDHPLVLPPFRPQALPARTQPASLAKRAAGWAHPDPPTRRSSHPRCGPFLRWAQPRPRAAATGATCRSPTRRGRRSAALAALPMIAARALAARRAAPAASLSASIRAAPRPSSAARAPPPPPPATHQSHAARWQVSQSRGSWAIRRCRSQSRVVRHPPRPPFPHTPPRPARPPRSPPSCSEAARRALRCSALPALSRPPTLRCSAKAGRRGARRRGGRDAPTQ
eukprot:scaffold25882_cov25-Tisochrysis_lutea.AAC.1